MRLKKMFQHRAIDILILLLISFFVHRNWFQHNILITGEVTYHHYDYLKSLSFRYLWDYINNAGNSNYFSPVDYPFMLLRGLLTDFFSLDISNLIVYKIPLTVLPVLTIYFLVYRLFNKDRIASFFASLFFSLNTYILHLSLGGQPHGVLATAFAPLPILFFILGIDKDNLKYIMLGALALTLQIIVETRFTYLTSIIILFYFLYHLISIFRERKFLTFKEEMLPSFRNLVVFFLIPVLFHFHWILPIVMQKGISFPSQFTQPYWVYHHNPITLARAITLFHPWASIPSEHVREIQLKDVRSLYWFIPLLVFLAPFLVKKKKIWFFTFIALFFVFFAKGAHFPLGKIYIWCFKHLPGFNTFRDSSKLFMGVTLSYAILLGCSISELYRWMSKRDILGRRYLSKIFIALSFIWLIYLIYPHWNDQLVGRTYLPRPMGEDYKEIRTFITQDETEFRTLWHPFRAIYTFYSQKYPIVGNVTLKDFDLFFYRMDINKECLDQTDYWGKLLGLLNVKYVVLPPLTRGEWVYEARSTTREEHRKKLLSQKDITPTSCRWVLFNRDYLPHIYRVPSGVLVVGGGRSLLGLASLSLNHQIFRDISVFFADELKQHIPEVLGDIDTVIFYRQDLEDLVLSLTKPGKRIELWDYAVYVGENDEEYSHFEKTAWPPNGDLGHDEGELAQSLRGVAVTADSHRSQKMEIDFKVEKEDVYEIWIRLGYTSINGSMELTLDGRREKNINTQSEQGYYHWVKYDEFQLLPGKHILKIIAHPDGSQQLDQIVILTKGEKEKQETWLGSLLRNKDVFILSDIAPNFKKWNLATKRGKPIEVNKYFRQRENYTVKWKKINPTKYEVEYTQNTPAYLIFSESYNPDWILKLNSGEVIQSQKAYSRINSFYVGKSGEIKGTIEYYPQKYLTIGYRVSGVLVLGLFLSLSWYGLRSRRKIRKKLKAKEELNRKI